MAQRFPASGPSPAPPAGSMPPQQRYPGPAQPPGSPMPPRPYAGPTFPPRSGFTPPPAGAGPVSVGVSRPGGPAQYPGGAGPPPGVPRPPAPAPSVKRPPDQRAPLPPPHKTHYGGESYVAAGKRKKRLADKVLPQKVRDLVPESQAYMDLLAFERKLDATIMRKRLDIQEALKRPMKQKRKLRIFISNTFYPGQGDNAVASWELRVEGRLLDDSKNDPNKSGRKRKFSSFFKSLVIELDKELYGPDNHLVEWHRTLTTQETDGFQVKRPGYKNVRCTILLLLDYQPLQFKLDARLARLLGVHTQARPVIVNALWQYVKTHKLQDPHEREYVVCDKYLEQIFGCARMKLAEVPARLGALLHAPDPIVINHLISVEPPHDAKQTACYDIDVEVDDTLKAQMNSFLMSTANQQEIQGLDSKIHETVDTINQLKTNREFFLSFSKDPQQFIQKWLVSQSRDLKTMGGGGAGGGGGNPEEERRSSFYSQAWAGEGVARYLHGRLAARRRDLEHALAGPHHHLTRL
ncbi:SWI/SNF-related matrix-associated actin-dependent regulator of chromatin subfamily D member 1 [Danaus plexippus plexippus]|uniref:SWI/SNF-related matrix-associated actin-dependent regulator of chromatin subfamily D member 1 n=1 Tax=Danaus plexippus plexippus TaxID=278856 RepID=A0A212F517_DANPL|nr:SWI/SNF-related matrix-associated actin-dependent regulator of chromatin subfamily D member 1 [Danaus plexippus plexippus]